jgi:hypothetical protein
MCTSCTAAQLLCDKVQRQKNLMPTVGKRHGLGKMEIFIFATVICALTSSVTVLGLSLSPYSIKTYLCSSPLTLILLFHNPKSIEGLINPSRIT